MQTFIINKNDLNSIFKTKLSEPVIVKNEIGLNYLVMPFSQEKWQDIFLMLFKSFNEIENFNIDNEKSEQKMTSIEFVEKWSGILTEDDIKNWKEDYNNYLIDKHK